jgi:hypothetical protein
MKKIFLVAIVLFVGTKVFCQVPYELGATKHDSVYFNETQTWVTGVGRDTVLTTADSNKLVNEEQMKKYVTNTAASASGTSALVDSIAAHTDTLQKHRQDIAGLSANRTVQDDSLTAIRVDVNTNTNNIATHADSLTAIRVDVNLNTNGVAAHADSITALRVDVNANTNAIASHTGSIAAHTDTLQALRSEVNDLTNNGVTGLSTVKFIYICTTDTTSTSPASTGYYFGIDEDYAGYKLVRVVIRCSGDPGDLTPSVNVYRRRGGFGGTEVAMTSAGGDFNDNAAIDLNNDDLADGDEIEVRWTYSGSGDAPDGLYAILTLQKP